MQYGIEQVPPGGFVYDVKGQHVEAFSRKGLIAALIQYRQDNRLPIGDAVKDVDDVLMKRGYNSPINAGETTHKPKGQTFLDEVRNWVANQFSRRGVSKRVLATIARKRATICARCPHNQNWRNACIPCVSEVERDIVILTGNARVTEDRQLMACAIAKHENRIAVWLEQPHYPKRLDAFKAKLPKFCWMLK